MTDNMECNQICISRYQRPRKENREQDLSVLTGSSALHRAPQRSLSELKYQLLWSTFYIEALVFIRYPRGVKSDCKQNPTCGTTVALTGPERPSILHHDVYKWPSRQHCNGETRCPQRLTGAHSGAAAELDAEISVFFGGRWSGGGGGGGGVGRGRRGERREREREDGERVGPGCWCEWDEGRKRREKISIYGKKNRREYHTGGLHTARTVIRSEDGNKAVDSSAARSADICVFCYFVCVCVCFCFFYLCNRRWGRRTRQRREEEKMLWSATRRDVERERATGRGRTTPRMVVLRGDIARMRRPCDKSYRLAMTGNFRRGRFFWQAARARRPSVEALRLKLASLLCGRAAARLK